MSGDNKLFSSPGGDIIHGGHYSGSGTLRMRKLGFRFVFRASASLTLRELLHHMQLHYVQFEYLEGSARWVCMLLREGTPAFSCGLAVRVCPPLFMAGIASLLIFQLLAAHGLPAASCLLGARYGAACCSRGCALLLLLWVPPASRLLASGCLWASLLACPCLRPLVLIAVMPNVLGKVRTPPKSSKLYY